MIGIPKGLFYYYYKDIWINFFKYLNIDYIVSPNTNKEIIDLGVKYSQDEMCQSFKTYIGHIAYLDNRCDYILVPRIDNYKKNNQMCTNFLGAYDLINNMFDTKLLNYNIDLEKHQTLKKGLYKLGKELNIKKVLIKKAYNYSYVTYKKNKKREIINNLNKLNRNKTKILIVSHPYITYDELMGKQIISYLENNNIEIIYSDKFDSKITNKLSKKLSKDLYFKFSKENIGSIEYSKDKINGIIFLTSFPCVTDNLVNELVIRKINIPSITITLDENDSFTGIETRLESFIDMLGGNYA